MYRHESKKVSYQEARDDLEDSFEMTYALLRLLEKELLVQRVIEEQKAVFQVFPKQILSELFDSLTGSKGIGIDELLDFMQNFDISSSKEDAERVIRRLDRDGDGLISYTEFIDAFLVSCKELDKELSHKWNLENFLDQLDNEEYSTPSKTEYNNKHYNLENNVESIKKSLFPIDDSTTIDIELIDIFKKKIRIFAELELAKAKLWLRPDFELLDLFYYFNHGEKDIIPDELLKGLHNLHINCSKENINLLMTAYDRNLDGRLDIEEFEKMFKPVGNIETITKTPRGTLSSKTDQLLKDCLSMLIETEIKLNNLHRTIRTKDKKGEFSILNAFHLIDTKQKGCIDMEDVLH
jgi:Ca2+-binding EF-hand superfamily protein